eukprot:GEMP01049164.1.p1 GENE.GEMP01049164.1~~GEMP01049164.1.p1  ORF type:complete len:205 (+),score=18.39 GEMP01049164.1:164-778(+)
MRMMIHNPREEACEGIPVTDAQARASDAIVFGRPVCSSQRGSVPLGHPNRLSASASAFTTPGAILINPVEYGRPIGGYRNSSSGFHTYVLGYDHERLPSANPPLHEGLLIEAPPWSEILIGGIITIFVASILACIPLVIAVVKASQADKQHAVGLINMGNESSRLARKWMKFLYLSLVIWCILDFILLLSVSKWNFERKAGEEV